MEKINFKGKTILAVGAHPDDNDFGFGATIAKATKAGAEVIYLLATIGQRGSSNKLLNPESLSKIRRGEQEKAAKILGVKSVHFLDYNDGELVPNIQLKEEIVRFIRWYKPEIVFTSDPSRFYFKEYGFINHTDHRAIGEATLDAVYPLARDLLSFPEQGKIGLKPHKVKEILMPSFLPEDANCFIDVSNTFKTKIKALLCHQSQIKSAKELRKRMEARASLMGEKAGFKLAEAFIRLKLPS